MRIILIALLFTNLVVAGESLKKLREMGKKQGWTFEVGDTGVNNVPIEDLTGLVEPKDWQKTAKFKTPKVARTPLPDNFDVRDILGGHMPKVHRQTCGSCWAESSVMVFEIAIALHEVRSGKKGPFTEDISVQELVDSCCSYGTCRGGWVASQYHVDKGATYEKEYPYVGRTQRCKKQRPVYKLEDWGWLGAENRKPTVDEIRQAIFQYGATTATVAAGGMSAYKSGIFNRCGAWSINHLVVLIGWKTIDGKLYWIMMNSWGTGWGMDGFMIMPPGCARIANSASYVVYKPKPGPICGNKVIEPPETCDDGNRLNGDGCDENCQVEVKPECGNGKVETGEQCDVDLAWCVDCKWTNVCGNDALEKPPEQCDDGNVTNGDGCDSKCNIEEDPEPTPGPIIRILKWIWSVIVWFADLIWPFN